jgi:hypothetical protein
MKHGSTLYLFSTAIAAVIGCTSETGEAPLAETTEAAACVVPTVDIDRSLFVSPTAAADQLALRARFPVSRIMGQILASSGAAQPINGIALWQRWWDTQNSSLGAVFVDNPHCNDSGQTINGFPVACPRNEGALALSQPSSHFPVALVYRPDLTPADFSTCGEARIVIAKPNDATGRNLPIFEASIPNPEPSCPQNGCRKIAQFWANLSTVASFSQRLDALERFYFLGLDAALDGVATQPVISASNLGLASSTGVRRGQIRTNQFMTGPNPQIWQLREFQLAITCTGPAGCKLFFEPVSVKTNPFGPLFNDANPHPLGPAYRNQFLGQLSALSPQDVNAIGMSTTAQFNAGQSNAQGTENNYLFQLNQGNPAGFKQAITNQLALLGLPLTADNMATRATTQSCGGCHQLSNNVLLGGLDSAGNPLRWPASAGFVHAVENGTRSPALNNVFLPKRKSILEQFLVDTCDTVCPASSVSAARLAPSGADGEEVPLTITGKRTVH